MKDMLQICGILGLMLLALIIISVIVSVIFDIAQKIEIYNNKRKLIGVIAEQIKKDKQ